MRIGAVRTMSVYKGGVPTKDEFATGMERVQLEAFKAGVADPFDREPQFLADLPEGTGKSKDKPIEIKVPTGFDRRIVGCKCERSAHNFSYMNVYVGDEPKRCSCGIWMKAIQVKSPGEIWTPEEMKFDPTDKIPGL